MTEPFIPPAPASAASSTTTIDIELASILVIDRLRPADEAVTQAIAASFSEHGQDQPIIVRPGPDGSNAVILVAGLHRLHAAELLEWESIRAELRPLTEDEARLVEIDENLIRAELTVLDRAVFLATRKEIYETLHPEAAHGKTKKPKTEKGKVANMATFARYSKDAAAKTGLSERSIQRATELASKLDSLTISVLRSTKLADNQAQLKALCEVPREQQLALVTEIALGRASNLRAARVSLGHIPADTVRPEDAPLAALERMLARLSLEQLQGASRMVAARIAALKAEPKPAKTDKAAKPARTSPAKTGGTP